jgi:hypothetical protein
MDKYGKKGKREKEKNFPKMILRKCGIYIISKTRYNKRITESSDFKRHTKQYITKNKR